MNRIFLILLVPLFFITACKDTKTKPVKDKEAFELISRYETVIYDKIEDRLTNLNICASYLNGLIIKPYEEFSFNTAVGERTEEKGYREAITYDEHGEKKMDIGGGICQISSTINMAAKNAGLKITERHTHKHEVPYEVLGNDAAVSYNVQDFKFINNKDKPIKLEVIINGSDSVITNIYITED